MKFKVALHGIIHALKNEINMKIHVAAAFLVCIVGVYINLSKGEWIGVTICIAAVISAEIFNSAMEELCDIVQPEQHKGIGLVKDMAAGAVLIVSMAAAVVGLIVFVPYLIELFH
jgi:undecaprenol kinase